MLRKRNLMSDKRGSTLIEVIVSVLIVGIAFVPLMVGLNAALSVNRQTENTLYAENVASNVIEVSKTYGVKGFESLYKAASGESVSGGGTSGEATSGETIKSIGNIFSGSTLIKNGVDDYTITNITSGTDRHYTANVHFSPIVDNQNDFSGYPSVEGVKEAIVVSFEEDNFNNVFSYFWDKVKDQAFDPTHHLSEQEMRDNISLWLKRELVITLEKQPAESGSGEKIVSKKKIVYTANNNPIDMKYPFRDSDPNAAPDPLVFQPVPSSASGAPVGRYSVVPKMIIVTYKQFKDSNGKNIKLKGDGITGDNIRLEINDGVVGGDIYLYALSENGRTLRTQSYDVAIVGSDNCGITDGNVIHAYSNLNLISYSGCVPEYTFGTADLNAIPKMKNVTVTISEDGKEVATKTSTLIEME